MCKEINSCFINRKDYSTIQYLCCTFIGTWIFWILAIFTKSQLLIWIGGIFPSMTGAFLANFRKDKLIRKNYWNRVLNFKLIGFKYYIVIFSIIPFTTIAAFLTLRVFDANIPSLGNTGISITNPFQLCILIVLTLIGGPLTEELGWRGFLLDCLQKRMNALCASIFLGFIHACWHIPLFFVEGNIYETYGLLSFRFPLLICQVIVFSIFFTWMYNNNNHSILSAILFHFMINFTSAIVVLISQVNTPVSAILLSSLFMLISVLIILRFYDYRTFLKKP